MNLLPAAAAAWLAAQLTQEFEAKQPSLADQIPGYGGGYGPKPGPSHTGNDKTTNPMPGGTSTTYPAEGPKESGVVGGKPLDPQKPEGSILPGKPAEPLPGIGPVFNEGADGGVVADEAAALGRIGGNANGPVLNGKAPNTVLNQQAVNDLANGLLPGITKNPNTGLPDAVPRIGVPREMPGSPNPSATAEDFANRLFGGTSTPANAKPIPNCNGCWNATNADGVAVTYRPASTASADTAASTASVDINFKPNGNAINGGKPVKLKFPQVGG